MTRDVKAILILAAATAAVSIQAQNAKVEAQAPVATAKKAFFDGAQDPASKQVIKQAEADIEKYRKGGLKVVLVDENGKPINGEATVDLIRHQFNFGVSMFGLSRKADDDPMKKAGLQTILDIFNQVVVVDHWYNPYGEVEDKQPAKDIAWAEANNMRMRYHAILYEEGREFLERPYTQEEYWRAFEERIKYCAEVTQGKPSSYDVINEVITRKVSGQNNPQSFYRLVPDYPDLSKPELIVRAFALARKYLPNTNLTALEGQAPSVNNSVYTQIIPMWKAALDVGADIDHIGTQCHFFDDGQPFQPEARTKDPWRFTMAAVSKALDLQKVLNKPIEVTEFTGPSRSKIKSEEFNKQIWTMSEAENAAWQINFYKLVFSKPYIIGLTRWNLIDEYCGRSMDGGVLTKTGERHQIYYDLKKLIKQEWHTNVAGQTAKDGSLSFRGFYGDYSVTVKGYEPATVTLVPGTTTVKVVLKKTVPRPKLLGIAHIAFYTGDFANSRHYFSDYLGYTEILELKRPQPGGTDSLTWMTAYKVNDDQIIELFPEKPDRPNPVNKLFHIGLLTDDAEGMRLYLASKGCKVPPKTNRGKVVDNLNYNVTDPNGTILEIVQYPPDGYTARTRGQGLSTRRLSTRISHVGFSVPDVDKALDFYVNTLGFTEIWRNGPTPDKIGWIHLKFPDSNQTLELMLYENDPQTKAQSGSRNHLCLEVKDIKAVEAGLAGRTLPEGCRTNPPSIGKNDHKWQLNTFNSDGTRIEFMEDHTWDGTSPPSSTGEVMRLKNKVVSSETAAPPQPSPKGREF